MADISLIKLVITVFNICILLALPISAIWHGVFMYKQRVLSHGWWMECFIISLHILAINAEIPAFWSRLLSFYTLHLDVPEILYALQTWDRWGHVIFYAGLIPFFYMISKQISPKTIIEALG